MPDVLRICRTEIWKGAARLLGHGRFRAARLERISKKPAE